MAESWCAIESHIHVTMAVLGVALQDYTGHNRAWNDTAVGERRRMTLDLAKVCTLKGPTCCSPASALVKFDSRMTILFESHSNKSYIIIQMTLQETNISLAYIHLAEPHHLHGIRSLSYKALMLRVLAAPFSNAQCNSSRRWSRSEPITNDGEYANFEETSDPISHRVAAQCNPGTENCASARGASCYTSSTRTCKL